MSEVTKLLDAIAHGDSKATNELLPLVYEELRRVAAQKMAGEMAGHTLQPTALVHEAWLRLGGDHQPAWQNRAHFFGAAAEAMRRILIENARRKSRLKRGAGADKVDLDESPIAAPDRDETLLAVNEALNAFEADDPEKARIVKLKFFVGMTNQQVAESLGVTERTVERAWAYAKAWLFREIGSQQ